MEPGRHASIETLALEWDAALRRCVGGAQRLTVLYSGGLDSSLVAAGVRGLAQVELVTLGAAGSHDLVAAERGARILELPWRSRTLTKHDVEGALARNESLLAESRSTSQAVLVGISLALDSSSDPLVACGQGADELFLGYAHFERLSREEASQRRDKDLEQLLREDWPRSQALARSRGKSLVSPFLDPEFLEVARGLSIDDLQAGAGRKPFLRALAERLGLPDELVTRPKKAFQYGSGIERLLRRP